MRSFFQYLSSRKIILIFCFFYLAVRMIFLDQTFLLPDERDLALTGYSVAKTGHDLFGNYYPLKFERISPNAPAVTMYYDVFWWKIGMIKNVTNARLAFVLPASLLPILVFELVLFLTKKKKLSYLVCLIFCLSPWIYNISRLGLEINLALPLILAAMLLQLNRKSAWSYFFYFLTFFSYQGLRPLVLTIPIYLEFYFYLSKKITFKKFLLSSSGYIFSFVVFALIGLKIEGNLRERTGELIFFKPYGRRHLFNMVLSRILKGWDLSFLFKSGDYVPQYNNGVAGQFYGVLLIFLFLGIFALKNIPLGEYFLIGFALLGLLPSLINVYSLTFSIRSALAALGLSALMAEGVSFVFNNMKKLFPYLRLLMTVILSTVLFLQMTIFFRNYYVVKPALQADVFGEKDKVLATYVLNNKSNYSVESPLPYSTFMSYVFMSDLTKKDLQKISAMLNRNWSIFYFNNLTFKRCEANQPVNPEDLHKVIVDEYCLTFLTKQRIQKKLNVKTLRYFNKPAYFVFD